MKNYLLLGSGDLIYCSEYNQHHFIDCFRKGFGKQRFIKLECRHTIQIRKI